MSLSKNAITILKQRYCHPGEQPKDVFIRVANALSLGDTKFEKKLLKSMEEGVFLPNSPCIRNAGMKKGMLHACFVLPIMDEMESITNALKNMMIIFKNGGGVGINFSKLRPQNAQLSGGGSSSGVVSFMSLFNTATEVVKQGGFRRGALMGVLNFEHAEIIEFIRSKLTGNSLTNFNISVLVSDIFMKKIETGEDIDLINPQDNKIWGKINARTIFDVICFAAWNGGDPGLLFYDRINKDNILFPKTKIKCTNPCQPNDALLLDGDRLSYIREKGKNWTSWLTGKKEVLSLYCNNGSILRFTPEHKIMLENGDFIEAKNSIGVSLKWGLGNREARFVDPQDVLKGFLFGDGCLSGGKLGVSVKINKNKEKKVVELLKSFGFYLQKSGGYYINRKKLPFDTKYLSDKVYNRNIPDDIICGDSNTVASFLRGLFEANGSCSINGQISLKATCRDTVEKVQILLASFGIPSWIINNKEYFVKWTNGIYKSRKSYNLQIASSNAILFKNKIGFLSDYKNNKIKNIDRKYSQQLKVVKIESLGEQEVWDYQMKKSPHHNFCQGIIAKNCGEVPLPDYGACCLGSINISKFVKYGKFQMEEFEKILELAVRALRNNNVISCYPLQEITKTMKELDPIGVGIMGFADALIMLGINYDSDEALNFIDEIGEVYKRVTDHLATKCLWKRIIAPTGTLSIIADCSSGIEPIFETSFERHLTVGVIQETREIYKSKHVRTAHQISPEWHLKIQAQWQKWCDGSISKTINLPNHASIEDVKNIYTMAWKLGCKGITIFRDGSKAGVLVKKKEEVKRQKCDGDTCTL